MVALWARCGRVEGALWAHCGFRFEHFVVVFYSRYGHVVGKLWANCMCTRSGSVVMFVEGASSWKLLHNTLRLKFVSDPFSECYKTTLITGGVRGAPSSKLGTFFH